MYISYRYIGCKASQFDERILEIHLSSNITHSITERKYWKGYLLSNMCICIVNFPFYVASEWRSVLLHYTPIALWKILPDKYYVHAIMLTKAIRILLSNSISRDAIKLADKLIKKFCSHYEEFYGVYIATGNLHII